MRSSSGYIFVLIWAYSQVAQAYTKFEPECTNPQEVVNFVDSPPTRGTLDILWSSLFTIFACTWSVLHLNVPEQRGGRDPGRWGDLKWLMKAFWGKAKWMFWTVMAPEALLYFAVTRYMNAGIQHPQIKELADADRVPWTLSHTTFADMGGFVIRGSSDRAVKDPGSEMSTTQTQSPDGKEWYILDLDIILKLRSEGHIVLPCIQKAEIDDHSKGDAFTKGIAAVQIIWSIASAITRACRGLAISQLEISVIAFSACALILYAYYWSSPKDVSVPITFLHWVGPIPPTITKIIKGTSRRCFNRYAKTEIGKTPFTNGLLAINGADGGGQLSYVTILFGPLFFG
ncbi:hypothetical protein VE04_10267, partial [Pseudogymnoascus sp. 24MN13]